MARKILLIIIEEKMKVEIKQKTSTENKVNFFFQMNDNLKK